MNKDAYVEQQEHDHEEAQKWRIATRAAILIVVERKPRDQAIRQAKETQIAIDEAESDPRRVKETLDEAQEPTGARSQKQAAQIKAVAKEIHEILEGMF